MEMRKRIALVLLFAILFQLSRAQDADVLHYKFSIDLYDQHDTIYGKAEILVKFLKESIGPEFDLVQLQTNGKGMSISKIEGKRLRGFQKMPKEGKIKIHQFQPSKAGDTATFTVFYQGIPADGLIISKTKYGRRSFFADNWPDRGHHWLPVIDHPADKASVEFLVTAPAHYQVVANGLQIEETNIGGNRKLTHWKETTPISTKVMVIGVAEFAVNLAGFIEPNIPVYSWVYPEDREKGFYDYGLAIEILQFFVKKIGPYPYSKLANVQSKTTFGGLENANTIFYAENSVTGTRSSESLLAHEIAHQWFGNHATEKTFAHLWLSEGFATFMTIVYMENKYGKDTALKMLVDDRNELIEFARRNNRPVVDDTTDFMQLLNSNSYEKGNWILHMLRNELGDSVFFRAIRGYYHQFGGRTAGSEDLQKVFESVSKQNLSAYFSQWLYQPGIPRIEVKWNYNSFQKKLQVSINQLQDHKYQFPLEILIVERNNKKRIEKIFVKEKTQTVSISLPHKPAELILDPNTVLLFEGTVTDN